MTDIHSHILFEVDDGCKDIEESVELIKKLKECGFERVILTPHFIEDNEYKVSEKDKKSKLRKLKTKLKDVDIELSLGSEVFMNNNISDYLKKKEINTLNNTKYILIELPMKGRPLEISDTLYEILRDGYIPVIAHPERCLTLSENKNLIKDLREDGVLFQCNYGSIIGKYGKEPKKMLKYMLRHKYVDFLATDIHRNKKNSILAKFKKIERKIKMISGKKYYKQIVSNSDKLYNNEEI